MISSFEQAGMAEGYAQFRPPVHRKILERALPPGALFDRALDIGCGAGVSTRALAGFANFAIGMEPVVSMLPANAGFLGGAAEAIPVRTGSIDLITAAGSLNYVDLDLFFPEAARVLRKSGLLIVYDFEPGRSIRDKWFDTFTRRYPWPPHEAKELNPEKLHDCALGFQMESRERFEISTPLAREFYLEYMLTETNVAFATQNGTPREEIRSWCAATLNNVWAGQEQEIVFRGYYACMVKRY